MQQCSPRRCSKSPVREDLGLPPFWRQQYSSTHYLSSVERVAIASYGHPRCIIPHFAYLLVCRPFRPRLLYLQLFRFRVAVAVVVAVEDCSTEEVDVELLTMMFLEHAVMSAARSVETLCEAHNLTKQCVQRQQGCLHCCRASCRIGVESTAEVVHKSAVATRCASEQKEKIERCRLLLTDSQSQVCLGDEKE